jgi:uncharacterized membrane protein
MTERRRALITLLAVFLFGTLTGGGAVYVWMEKVQASAPAFGDLREFGPLALPQRLQLTPEQEIRFKEIMKESRDQFDAARAEGAPRFRELREEMHRKIFSMLNQEQRRQFETFVKEMESRRNRMYRPGS